MTPSKTFKVAIIDFQMGNMFSVQHACTNVGVRPTITSEPKEIMEADGAILPGVGAFGEAMDNLRRLDLIGVIKDFIASGKPFMGVCLGLQLLLSESEEFGMNEGLGIVKGSVVRFPSHYSQGRKLKVPQIGWNRINSPADCNSWAGTPLQDLKTGSFMYFVHSYYALPDSRDAFLTTTVYGDVEYCSSLLVDNVFAVQFHPEKSAHDGIAVYSSWAEISREAKEKQNG